jgi:hypothetical protein
MQGLQASVCGLSGCGKIAVRVCPPRAQAILTGSVAGNRSTFTLLAKYDLPFYMQKPGSERRWVGAKDAI